MIRSFADHRTEEVFLSGKSRWFPPEIVGRMKNKLAMIDLAGSVRDLAAIPSHRLHKLGGARSGQYSISVNRQWRVCFRFHEGDAYDVEIIDYH